MVADGNQENLTNQQQAVNRILGLVARYAPQAVMAVSMATAVVTTMNPTQAEASLPAWLFATGTGVGVNLLSDLIGDLARRKKPATDEEIMARLTKIFPVDTLEQLLDANRETVRQMTRMAAWQRQINTAVDQNHALGQLVHEQLLEVGADVAVIREALGGLGQQVAATGEDIKGHIDLRFSELTLRLGGERGAGPLGQFLSVEERRRLTAVLSALPQIAIDGAGGRLTFLNNNGLGGLVGRLPMNDKAEVFAGELVALAEAAAEPLADPAGLHPLGAVCAGVLRLDDAPRGDRPFLAGIILRHILVEDEALAGPLRAEFGAPEAATSWRETQRRAAGGERGAAFGQPPPPREEGIVGRDDDLAWLRARLLNEGSAAIAGLQGMGGIGKSEAAKVLAVELRERFGGRVAWIDCGSNSVQAVQELLAAEFGASLPADADETARGMALRRALDGRPPALIILDDVRRTHKAAFEALRPPAPPHALLVTTRLAGVLPDRATRVLGVLDDDDARALLAQELGDGIDSTADPEAMATIIELTEGVPQAIILAGRWLRRAMDRPKPPAAPLAALAGALRARRAVVLDQDPAQKNLSLPVAFDLSYDDLSEDDQRRLRALGVFGRRFFYLWGMATVWGEDEAATRRGVNGLEEAGLLQPYDEDAWWLHDVLRDYARAHLGEDGAEMAEAARRQAAYVEGVLDQAEIRSLEDWAWLASFRPEIERAGTWLLTHWREHPRQVAGLAVSLGNKLYNDATAAPVKWLRAGIEAARVGEQPAYEAQIATKLAFMVANRGQYEEAERLYRASLAVKEELGDSRSVAVTQSSLAGLLSNRGQYDEAERLYRASLAVVEGLGDSREVAVTQSSLAGLLRNRGQYDEAERLYRASLAVKEELGESRGVAVTQSSLAGLLSNRGQYDEAERLYRAGLETTTQIRDMQGVAVFQMGLGQLALARGDREGAREWLSWARQGFAAIGLTNWVASVDQLLAQTEGETLTLEDLAGLVRAARGGDSAAGQQVDQIGGALMESGDETLAALGDGLQRLLAGQAPAAALAAVPPELREQLLKLLSD